MGSLLLLDACCLINLLATGCIEEVLFRLPYRFATSRLVVTKEVLSLARIDGTEGPLEREVIPATRLESIESLSVMDLQNDREITNFVRFATNLDDGEASVCALAVAHDGGVATDDRKALRVLGQTVPRVPTLQTPEILYEWAQLSQVPENDLTNVLRAVQSRARFFPRRDAPRFEWWASYFR
jgi:hypothetical protein